MLRSVTSYFKSIILRLKSMSKYCSSLFPYFNSIITYSKSLRKLLAKDKENPYGKIDQLRYLSKSVLIEESSAPYMVRTILFIISVIIIMLIIWAGFTQIEEIAITEGDVIPSEYVQSIQHLEGGIIAEIKVTEGTLVDKGQTIIILDGTAVKRDLSALKSKKTSLDYNVMKLRSFVNNVTPDFASIEGEGVNPNLVQEYMNAYKSMIEAKDDEEDVIKEQIIQKELLLKGLIDKKATLEKNIILIREEKELKEQLYKKGHLSKFNFLQIQQELNTIQGGLEENKSEIEQANNAISEYKNRLEALGSGSVSQAYQELNAVENDITQLKESIKKLEEQVNRLEIKSPSYGYIKVLNIKTIGGVIEPGMVLAEVVPMEGALIVEIHIQPKDVGYIKVGQAVKVKVSTYDYSRYGTLKGELKYISATTFTTSDGIRYYMGRVSIDKNYVGNDSKQNIILPGMTVQADIVTGSKSILAYLLKPIRNTITTAFSER